MITNDKVIQFLSTCASTCIGWEEPKVYPLIDGSHLVYLPVRCNKLMTVTIRHSDYMTLRWVISVMDVRHSSVRPTRELVYEDEALLLVRQFLQPPVKIWTTKTYLSAAGVTIFMAGAHYLGYLLGGD